MADDKKRPIIVVEGAAEWVVTYGDMMSLLLTFFIMLFSMSTLEVVKFQATAEALQSQFGYSMSADRVPGTHKGNARNEAVRAIGRAKRRDLLAGGNPVQAPIGDFSAVLKMQPKGAPVTGGKIMFQLGSDQIDQQAQEDLKILATKIAGSPYRIEIRGHTAPVEKGIYSRNNWDLSYTRAFNVMEFFVKECGIREKNLRVSSVAQFEPPEDSLKIENVDNMAQRAFVEIFRTEELVYETDEPAVFEGTQLRVP